MSRTGLVVLQVADTGRQRSRRAPAAAGAASGTGLVWSCPWGPDGPGGVSAGCEGEPSLTLVLSPDDAEQVRRGELAPSVAFMQGRLKTTGDNELLLVVLEWSARAGLAEALAKWEQQLELGQHGSEPPTTGG